LGPVGARDRAKLARWKDVDRGGGFKEDVIKYPQIVILADHALKGRRNMTTGANKDDHHIRGVDVSRDFDVDQWVDLREVQAGEGCPQCDSGVLEIFKGMEIGHIFKLGTKYSESMGATVLNQDGKEVPIIMGSYGIGVDRILSVAVEQHHDEDGIIWPKSLAPFDVVVTITNMKQDDLRQAGERLYEELQGAGLEVLLDDRDERAGVKFKDADLIGIPYRITIGKKVAEGVVELFDRHTKRSEDVKIGEVAKHVLRLTSA
jgi:prolyl-tRNA synthetase